MSKEVKVLIVSDSGAGMSPQDCVRMFKNAEGFDLAKLHLSTLLNEYVRSNVIFFL